MRRTLEISPTFTYGHFNLGLVLLARSKPQAALAEMLKEGDEAHRLGGSSMAYFALGAKAESDAALAQLLKLKDEAGPYTTAEIYAFRGESDEAFKWLDRAYAHKDAFLYKIKGEVPFAKLQGDPRYKAFLRKMNLPE